MTPHGALQPPHRRAMARTLALAAALAAAACHATPLVAPSASTLTTVVADTVLPAGGATTVTAHLVEAAGTAVHDGTVVTFTATLGDVHPAEAATVRGRATAVFTAGDHSGIAEIRAWSGAAAGEPVEVAVGAAAVAGIRLAAQPGSLPPHGGDATLVATVLDTRRNPLPAVAVTFATTAGTLRPVTATTDGGGNARSRLTTTATAEVTATAGDLDPALLTVTVAHAPRIGLTATPAAPTAGQPVAFDVAVEPGAHPVRRAAIDFGDGHDGDLGAVTHATVVHAYQAPGAYTVTLTATDTAGHAVSSAIVVVVTDAPAIPVTLTADPAAPAVEQPVTFTIDVSPPENAPAVRDVTVDFGDGDRVSLGALTGAGAAAHVYRRPGPYVVTATVHDAAGRRSASSLGLTVAEAPAIAVALTAAPTAPAVDEPVVFTVTVARPAGAPAVRDVTLDFDDGDDEALGALEGAASIAHVYRRAGSYLPRVTARDVLDRRRNASTGVTVSRLPEPPEIGVTLTAAPATAAPDETIIFTIEVAADAAAPVTAVGIDFGDGTGQELAPTRSRQETVHAYREAGAFVAVVTVSDAAGGRGAAGAAVTIQ